MTRVEATSQAEREWTAHANEVASKLLASQVDSWMTRVNRNVEGREKRTFVAYAGARQVSGALRRGGAERLRGLRALVTPGRD